MRGIGSSERFPLGVCGRIHSMEGEYPCGEKTSNGSTSEFRRMHAGVACGTEGNQVVLGIVAGLAAKFLVMNLKI